MALVSIGFQNLNEQRAYPLHERSTGIDRTGKVLPHDILADANVAIPSNLGRVVFISSLGISANLVTLTLLANPNTGSSSSSSSSSGSGDFVPVGVVRVARPVIPYKNYAIEPLYPGVKGWFAFGAGTENHGNSLNLFFDTPLESGLIDKVVRSVFPLPVLSISKRGALNKLTGMVRLQGSTTVETKTESRMVDGEMRRVAVLSLKIQDGIPRTDYLHSFAGPCFQRPAEGTCTELPINSINGVVPDKQGNINLVFSGYTEIIGDTGDGIIIDSPNGLATVCPPKDFNPPEPPLICLPSSSSSSSSSSESSSSSSETPTPVSSSSSSECAELSTNYGYLMPVSGAGYGHWDFAVDVDSFTRLTARDGEMLQNLAISDNRFRIFNIGDELVLTGTVRPGQSSTGEAHLLFGYTGANNFFFAGVTLRSRTLQPTGQFFIGRKSAGGPSWPNGLGSGYNFLAGGNFSPPAALQVVDYALELRVKRTGLTTAQVTLIADWTDPVFGAESFTSSPFPILDVEMDSFRVGLGCILSPKSEFANVCVNGGRLFL